MPSEAIGWADSVNHRPGTPDSPFLLASLNKTVETALAAALQSQHRIDLDRPVNEYLRTTSISSPIWDASHVTVRYLYQQMAGLSTFNIGCDCGGPRDKCHMPNADDTIKDHGIVVAKPRERFDDSNLGFVVGSEAVARAARQRSFHTHADSWTDYLSFSGWASVHDLALFAAPRWLQAVSHGRQGARRLSRAAGPPPPLW